MKINYPESLFLIIGAAGGIGKSLVAKIHQRGGSLILADLDPELLEAVNTNQAGGAATIVAGDVTDPTFQRHLAASVDAKPFHRVIVINCAGINRFGEFQSLSEGDIRRVIEIGLTAPLLITHQLLPVLARYPSADLVAIGSAFGAIGYPGFVPYCASKFGLRGFMQALDRELGESSIRCIHVAPRAVKTALNAGPVGEMNRSLGVRMDDPEWVAEKILNAVNNGNPDTFLGWPEKLFARVNGALPNVVRNSLRRQLPKIRPFLNRI